MCWARGEGDEDEWEVLEVSFTMRHLRSYSLTGLSWDSEELKEFR